MDENTPPPPSVPSPEPTPSAPPVDPAPAAAPAIAGNATGLDPNIAATICAALPLVGGIIFLYLEKTNAFVRFWAMQSVIFGGICVGISVAVQIVSIVLAHIPLLGWLLLLVIWLLSMAFWIASLVLWIMGIVKAFSNIEWEMPVIGKLARQQLARHSVA